MIYLCINFKIFNKNVKKYNKKIQEISRKNSPNYTNLCAYPHLLHKSSAALPHLKPFEIDVALEDFKIESRSSMKILPRLIIPSLSRQQGTTVPSERMPN